MAGSLVPTGNPRATLPKMFPPMAKARVEARAMAKVARARAPAEGARVREERGRLAAVSRNLPHKASPPPVPPAPIRASQMLREVQAVRGYPWAKKIPFRLLQCAALHLHCRK